MNLKTGIIVALVAAASVAQAQVASHAPALAKPAEIANTQGASGSMQVTGKAVVRVNGVELTDRDLVREMLQIFPYASTHNGFPKSQEESIRKGALSMIEFEELVYQDAEQRKVTVPPEKLNKAVAAYRKRFGSDEEFQQYLKAEMNGSKEKFRKTVRRSLLIEAALKSELDIRSHVTAAQVKEFYLKNPKPFTHPEQLQFQTISIMPPDNAAATVKEQAHKRANEAWEQAKTTHTYEEFGLLAEKYSQDDFRVDMGNHKLTPSTALPKEVLQILDPLKPGQVSSICQFGPYYAIFRLEARVAAGKTPFAEVQAKLQQDLQKERYNSLRRELDKRLRAKAKVEEL